MITVPTDTRTQRGSAVSSTGLAASRRKKEPLGRKRDREGKDKYMRKWPLRRLPDPKAPVVIIDDSEQAEELLRLADGSPPTP